MQNNGIKVIIFLTMIRTIVFIVLAIYIFFFPISIKENDYKYLSYFTNLQYSELFQKLYCIIVGIFLALKGILSIEDLKKGIQINQNLSVFSFCALIKCILFLILLLYVGFSILSGEIIPDNLSQSSCAIGQFKDINDTFLKLKDIWCKSKLIESEQGIVDVGCGCYINDFTIWSEEDQTKLRNVKEYSSIKSSKYFGAITVEQCLFLNILKEQNQKEIYNIKQIEIGYECSGICEGDIIYYFQDVNKSIPKTKHGCVYEIIQRTNLFISHLQIFFKVQLYSFVLDIPIVICKNILIYFFVLKFQFKYILISQQDYFYLAIDKKEKTKSFQQIELE